MNNKNRFFYRLPQEYAMVANGMYKVVILFAWVILFLSVVLVGRSIYGAVEPQYLSQDVRGRLAPLTVLQEVPGRHQAYIFLTDMLTQSFQFSSDTYAQQKPIIMAYFNSSGWQTYQEVLSKLGINSEGNAFFVQTALNGELVFDEKESGIYEGIRVFVYYVDLRHQVRSNVGDQTFDRRYKIVLHQVPIEKKPFALAVNSIRILMV